MTNITDEWLTQITEEISNLDDICVKQLMNENKEIVTDYKKTTSDFNLHKAPEDVQKASMIVLKANANLVTRRSEEIDDTARSIYAKSSRIRPQLH